MSAFCCEREGRANNLQRKPVIWSFENSAHMGIRGVSPLLGAPLSSCPKAQPTLLPISSRLSRKLSVEGRKSYRHCMILLVSSPRGRVWTWWWLRSFQPKTCFSCSSYSWTEGIHRLASMPDSCLSVCPLQASSPAAIVGKSCYFCPVGL